jgi:hypothetical protein
LTFEEIIQQADAIFVGTVVEQQSRYGSNQRMIFTDVTFEVQESFYTPKRFPFEVGGDIVLTFAGGEVEGETVLVSDVPSFDDGTTYLIFTRMDGKTYASPIIGAFQGLFKIISDEIDGTSYPLTYGGRGLVEIQKREIITSPPVARVIRGRIEIKSGTSPFTFHSVPPTPAEGVDMPDAKANISSKVGKIPQKIMTLEELVSHIQRVLQTKKEVPK